MINACLFGDCRDSMRKMIAEGVRVQTCVTSPPYWGLRDYGVEGQLGLESTPDEYVASMVEVFRLVRELLADDGTLWLNLGDSYAANRSYQVVDNKHTDVGNSMASAVPVGLKPKDLVGIPWSVAKALQAPYYNGQIKRELDRVWLAAMIDAEGTICGFTHERKDNGDIRNGIHVTVTNSNVAILNKCFEIWPTTREDHNQHSEGHFGQLPTWRWIVHGIEQKSQLLAELYPYFVGKKKQALLAWNFLEISKTSRGRNKGEEGQANRDKYAWIVDALSKLNHLESVDIPSWCNEPPPMFEPGWYLRSDVIWHKPNPMPESVTDRPTKAHEYLFLLSKRERYFYDADAIEEQSASGFDLGLLRGRQFTDGKNVAWHAPSIKARQDAGVDSRTAGDGKRNRRTVWTVATEPYSEAHFATFPTALIEPCILAGTSQKGHCPACGKGWARVTDRAQPPSVDPSALDRFGTGDAGVHRKVGGQYQKWLDENPKQTTGWQPACACNLEPVPGVVFDPFLGSGTTAQVAQDLGRHWLGCELSQEYGKLQTRRTAQLGMALV